MIKRTLVLSVVAGLVSGLLLFGGTAVMSIFSPVSAAELPALVAGQVGRTSDSGSVSLSGEDLGSDRDDKTVTPAAGSSSSASSQVSQSSSATPPTPPASTGAVGPVAAARATIAQLLASPASYQGLAVSATGRATRLDGDSLLINDGTGQILVELEDSLEGVAIADGATVTVVGRLDDTHSGRATKIEAQSLSDSSGTVLGGRSGGDDVRGDDDDDMDDLDDDRDDVDDDANDDVDDDADDDADDDLDDANDDVNDDRDDDVNDDMDDDVNDDADDDSNDDANDDLNDDVNDDAGDDSDDDSSDDGDDDDSDDHGDDSGDDDEEGDDD